MLNSYNKVYVVDTNVMLTDSKSILSFPDSLCIIPIFCLEELDRHKKDSGDVGLNARQTSRLLDQLRVDGSLKDGIKLDNGSTLIVSYKTKELPSTLGYFSSKDEQILATAYYFHTEEVEVIREVTMISNDINVKLRANAIGMKADGYEKSKKNKTDGEVQEIMISPFDIDLFYANNVLNAEGYGEFYENEYVVLKSLANFKTTALARYSKVTNEFKALIKIPKEGIFGIRPKNKEQNFALDALLNDDIKLVCIVGNAGCGKSLLAACVALQKVMEERKYSKFTISRPIQALGSDIGYIPGSEMEKVSVWNAPIYSTLEDLMGLGNSTGRNKKRSYQELIDMGIVDPQTITYMRGKNFNESIILIDEVQNLDKHTIKSIVTRCAASSKLILCGDVGQIDNLKNTFENNGLTHVMDAFKGQSLAASIILVDSIRGPLAQLASDLL